MRSILGVISGEELLGKSMSCMKIIRLLENRWTSPIFRSGLSFRLMLLTVEIFGIQPVQMLVEISL